jgi:hypothetical protein
MFFPVIASKDLFSAMKESRKWLSSSARVFAGSCPPLSQPSGGCVPSDKAADEKLAQAIFHLFRKAALLGGSKLRCRARNLAGYRRGARRELTPCLRLVKSDVSISTHWHSAEKRVCYPVGNYTVENPVAAGNGANVSLRGCSGCKWVGASGYLVRML